MALNSKQKKTLSNKRRLSTPRNSIISGRRNSRAGKKTQVDSNSELLGVQLPPLNTMASSRIPNC